MDLDNVEGTAVDNTTPAAVDSDDEFYVFTVDKKKRKKGPLLPAPVEFNPKFPASDPQKIKVVNFHKGPAKKKVEEKKFAAEIYGAEDKVVAEKKAAKKPKAAKAAAPPKRLSRSV